MVDNCVNRLLFFLVAILNSLFSFCKITTFILKLLGSFWFFSALVVEFGKSKKITADFMLETEVREKPITTNKKAHG